MRPIVPTSARAVLVLAVGFLGQSLGGEFERLEGPRLNLAFEAEKGNERKFLTTTEIGALPRLIRDADGGLVLARTDQGSLARLLVSFGLRKSLKSPDRPLPVIVIERFETSEPGKDGGRASKGSMLVLFDGFSVDLDGGFVVPREEGGDLVFLTDGERGPRLEALPGTTLLVPRGPLPTEARPEGPSPGKGIVPGDYLGDYRLILDGKWSGALELSEVQGRSVGGRFRSEPNGSVYPVSGQLDPASPNALTLTIRFPRSEMELQGWLWSEGKGGLSGRYSAVGRSFGFVAVREGLVLPGPSDGPD